MCMYKIELPRVDRDTVLKCVDHNLNVFIICFPVCVKCALCMKLPSTVVMCIITMAYLHLFTSGFAFYLLFVLVLDVKFGHSTVLF